MNKTHKKMSPAERAKQFMPFSALKGLEEALKAKEKVIISRKELSEEAAADLNTKLRKIKIGTYTEITFYRNFNYTVKKGIVTDIDFPRRCLKIEDTYVSFGDITEIR